MTDQLNRILDLFDENGDVDVGKMAGICHGMDPVETVETIDEIEHESRALGCIRIESESDSSPGHGEEDT